MRSAVNAPLTLTFRRLYTALFDAFGPKRLMWASDSPFQVQDGHRYAPSDSLIREGLPFLSESDREWLLARTAASVFFPERIRLAFDRPDIRTEIIFVCLTHLRIGTARNARLTSYIYVSPTSSASALARDRSSTSEVLQYLEARASCVYLRLRRAALRVRGPDWVSLRIFLGRVSPPTYR